MLLYKLLALLSKLNDRKLVGIPNRDRYCFLTSFNVHHHCSSKPLAVAEESKTDPADIATHLVQAPCSRHAQRVRHCDFHVGLNLVELVDPRFGLGYIDVLNRKHCRI